jgi:hypothetical protein
VLRTLVSIHVDLASSLAIRLACRLGNLVPMEIQPVYVKESPPYAPFTGAGWTPRTWEREVLQQGKEEIAKMIASEMGFCPVLQEPRVIFGDRETELLKMGEQESFDLYVEGVYSEWTAPMLHKMLHSKLHQGLSCPQVLVQGLREIQKVLVPCFDSKSTRLLTAALKKIWEGCRVPVHLAPIGTDDQGPEEALLHEVMEAKDLLEGAGCQVDVRESFPLPPKGEADDIFAGFGLVAMAIPEDIRRESAPFKWLQRIAAPVMLVMYR